DHGSASIYDQLESVAFLSVPNGDAFQAIYYDTPQSLTPKLVLADDRGLAGAGFWALGYDRGQPAYGDLIGQFRRGKLDTTLSPPDSLPWGGRPSGPRLPGVDARDAACRERRRDGIEVVG